MRQNSAPSQDAESRTSEHGNDYWDAPSTSKDQWQSGDGGFPVRHSCDYEVYWSVHLQLQTEVQREVAFRVVERFADEDATELEAARCITRRYRKYRVASRRPFQAAKLESGPRPIDEPPVLLWSTILREQFFDARLSALFAGHPDKAARAKVLGAKGLHSINICIGLMLRE